MRDLTAKSGPLVRMIAEYDDEIKKFEAAIAAGSYEKIEGMMKDPQTSAGVAKYWAMGERWKDDHVSVVNQCIAKIRAAKGDSVANEVIDKFGSMPAAEFNTHISAFDIDKKIKETLIGKIRIRDEIANAQGSLENNPKTGPALELLGTLPSSELVSSDKSPDTGKYADDILAKLKVRSAKRSAELANIETQKASLKFELEQSSAP